MRSLAEAFHKALPKRTWKYGLSGAVVTCLEDLNRKGLPEASNLARCMSECFHGLQSPLETGLRELTERIATPRLILAAARKISEPKARMKKIWS